MRIKEATAETLYQYVDAPHIRVELGSDSNWPYEARQKFQRMIDEKVLVPVRPRIPQPPGKTLGK